MAAKLEIWTTRSTVSFIAQALRMEVHNADAHINRGVDPTTSVRNLVSFGPVTSGSSVYLMLHPFNGLFSRTT